MRPPPTHTPAPQPVKNRKDRTAHTRNTHTTHRDAQTPSQHNTHPRPPHHQQCHPHTTPPRPPPPETRPRTQRAAASTSQLTSMPPPRIPPPTTATRDPITGPHARKRPAPPPNPHHPPHHTPHHQPPHRPNPTPYTTPQRYGSTSGDSGNRTCCASASPAPAPASGRPPWSRRPPLGEGVRDFLFNAFLHVARHDRPPRATPDGESPPPTGSRFWVPPIDWGRHLVGHPVPERDSTQGRTR